MDTITIEEVGGRAVKDAVMQFTFVDPCPYTLVGDLKDDCRVDLNDVAILVANWLVDCIQEPENPACVPK